MEDQSTVMSVACDEESLKCHICHATFSRQDALKRHLKNQHHEQFSRKNPSSRLTVVCDCGSSYVACNKAAHANTKKHQEWLKSLSSSVNPPVPFNRPPAEEARIASEQVSAVLSAVTRSIMEELIVCAAEELEDKKEEEEDKKKDEEAERRDELRFQSRQKVKKAIKDIESELGRWKALPNHKWDPEGRIHILQDVLDLLRQALSKRAYNDKGELLSPLGTLPALKHVNNKLLWYKKERRALRERKEQDRRYRAACKRGIAFGKQQAKEYREWRQMCREDNRYLKSIYEMCGWKWPRDTFIEPFLPKWSGMGAVPLSHT